MIATVPKMATEIADTKKSTVALLQHEKEPS